MSDKYRTWSNRAIIHDGYHHGSLRGKGIKEDLSCGKCHPLLVTNKRFIRFWKWYRKEVPQVLSYSGKTEEVLMELLPIIDEKKSKDRNERIVMKITKLLSCMRYSEQPINKESIIRDDLIRIIVASENFEKPLNEIEELLDEFTTSEAS